MALMDETVKAAAARFPAASVSVAKMYYTMCQDPGCGAINDWADTRAGAEENRRVHIAWHRRGGRDYDETLLENTWGPVPPTRGEVESWAQA